MWKWIEDWEVREWMTLIFAATAALIPLFIHRYNVRKSAEAESANWSIQLLKHMPVEGEFLWAELRLENPNENRVHLIALTAKRPKGMLLTGFANKGGPTPVYVPDPVTPAATLNVIRDLDAHRTYGSSSAVYDFSKLSFLIKMPSRPWYSHSDRVRAEIIAIVEDISSKRHVSRITINTTPIAWTASKNVSAT